jgi:hypothetical protein
MDSSKTQIITARFFEDAEWKLVEDMLLSKMSELEEISPKDLEKWAGNVEVEIKARMLCYNILKDFLTETKLVNREVPDYKNKFR